MKKLFIYITWGLLTFGLACQSPKVYLVRHAEKSTSPAKDPELTELGLQRAQDLAQVLGGKKIKAIYSTNTTRTRETAMPLSKKLGLAIQYYTPDTADKIVQNALKLKRNTLIVGHSNTLLPLIAALGLQASKKEIPDSEYDNLFMIYRNKGKLKLVESRYGKASVTGSDAAMQMK